MEKISCRIISLILSVLMIVSVLPLTALAELGARGNETSQNDDNGKNNEVDDQSGENENILEYVVLDLNDLEPKQPRGDGSIEAPFVISDGNELIWFADQVNGGNSFDGKTVALENNLDLSGITWEPVGVSSLTPFSGIFIGNGHEIRNFSVAAENKDPAADLYYIGFFGYLKNASINDLGIADYRINEKYSKNTVIGGFAAYMENSRTLNCYSKGAIAAEFEEFEPAEKFDAINIFNNTEKTITEQINEHTNENGQTVIIHLDKFSSAQINETVRLNEYVSYVKLIGDPETKYTGLSIGIPESIFNICIELVDVDFTGNIIPAISGDCNRTVYIRSNGSGNTIRGYTEAEAVYILNANVYICGSSKLDVFGGDGRDGHNGDGDKKDGKDATDGAAAVRIKNLTVNTASIITITSGSGGNGGSGKSITFGSGGNGGAGGKTNYAIVADHFQVESGNVLAKTGRNGNGGTAGFGMFNLAGRGGDAYKKCNAIIESATKEPLNNKGNVTVFVEPDGVVGTGITSGNLRPGVSGDNPILDEYQQSEIEYGKTYVFESFDSISSIISDENNENVKIVIQNSVISPVTDKEIIVANDVNNLLIVSAGADSGTTMNFSGISFVFARRTSPIRIELSGVSITGNRKKAAFSGENVEADVHIYSTVLDNSITGGYGKDAVYFPHANIKVRGTSNLTITGGSGFKGADGAAGEDGANASSNGANGKSGTNGKNGANGTNGGKGLTANTLYVKIIGNLTIKSGNGGSGGKGGDGGNGGNGGDTIWNLFDSSTWGNAGNGGKGGNGGNGGSGGKSDYAVSLNGLTIENGKCIFTSGKCGSGGKGGNGGNGGKGGDASSDGKSGGRGGDAGINGKGGNSYSQCNAVDDKFDLNEVVIYNGGSLRVTPGSNGSVGAAGECGTEGAGGSFTGGWASWGYNGSSGAPVADSDKQGKGTLYYGTSPKGTEIVSGYVTGKKPQDITSGTSGSEVFEEQFTDFTRLSNSTLTTGGFAGINDVQSKIELCSVISLEPENYNTRYDINELIDGHFCGINNGIISESNSTYIEETETDTQINKEIKPYTADLTGKAGEDSAFTAADAAIADPDSLKDAEGLKYRFNPKTAKECKYECHISGVEAGASDVHIHDYVFFGRFLNKITYVAESVFKNNTKLVSVSITGKWITSVPKEAFYGCVALETVTVSDSVKTIGDRAFGKCGGLKEFIIPDGVTEVGEGIFTECNNLEKITIGKSLKSFRDHDGVMYVNGVKVNIEQPLFGLSKSESRLKKYTVSAENGYLSSDEYGVLYRKIKIGDSSYEVSAVDAPINADLTGYVLPQHIVKIEPFAFAGNNTITSVNLDYVRMIGTSAFAGCGALASVELGSETDQSFDSALKEANISYNQYIDSRAFKGCSALHTVNIDAASIIGIGEEAFYDCAKLTDIRLGKNIQVIGLNAFGCVPGSSILESITVDKENSYFKSIGGVLYKINQDNNLTLMQYPACLSSGKDAFGKIVYVTEFALPQTDDDGNSVIVTAVESFAFQGNTYLKKVTLESRDPGSERLVPLTVGDYAFNYSRELTTVEIGANVTSIGLRRNEGEYSVFSECGALEKINVDENNVYYSSKDGVLFNKDQTKLIKYPAAKIGSTYEIPETVVTVGSMAFKNNKNLNVVSFRSYVPVIGMEAFYNCSRLALIFFDNVYAPRAIMENAFTTMYFQKDGTEGLNTLIGYNHSKYEDGESAGEIGWKTYEGIYSIQKMDQLPNVTTEDKTDDFYAVVLVDTDGKNITKDGDGNEISLIVSLTDPKGVTETVETGSFARGVGDGVAVFYNLYGDVKLGFAIDYDLPYSIKVADPSGTYMTFASNELYLDYDMRITYITLTKTPKIFGLNCNDSDINTQTAVLNKAEFGDNYKAQLIDSSKGYTEDNIKYVSVGPETVRISTVLMYDPSSFAINKGAFMLYQNGIAIPECRFVDAEFITEAESATAVFELPIDSLVPEVPVEVRFELTVNADGTVFSGSGFLNIDVIDFTLTEDDVNIDTEDLSVDLSRGGEILTILFGSPNLNFSLGKKGKSLDVDISVDGDKVTASLNAAFSKSKTKSKNYGTDYENGYKNNITGHHGNTWRFEKYFYVVDTDVLDPENIPEHELPDFEGMIHKYKMNIWFAKGTEAFGYYYYRCSVYDVKTKELMILYYGLVNTKSGRSGCAKKATLISAAYAAAANLQKDAKKGYKYIEPILNVAGGINSITTGSSTKNAFDATLYGDIVFQYKKGKGLVPVTTEIKGELKYTFEHKHQFVVWVIPVYVSIKVQLDGKIELSLKYDEWRSVSIEDAKMTLSAEITAKAGVGCEILSAGITGNIGTVFVMHFAPDFGIESWEIHGGIALYATYYTLKWNQGWLGLYYPSFEQETKTLDIYSNSGYIIDNRSAYEKKDEKSGTRKLMTAPLYIADAYSAAEPENYSEKARVFSSGDEIYKVCFTNQYKKTSYTDEQDQERFDEYNYLKLALFKWDKTGSKWDFITLLDDSVYNDFDFDIYQNEDNVYIIFAQQNKIIDENSASGGSEYVSGLSIKCISLNEALEKHNAKTITSEGCYKYLNTVSVINGTVTAVWAENADNNMFGVSKYNYVDQSGNFHVFETDSNSIWMSTFDPDSGAWNDPVCVKSGLSAITALTVTESGYIAYLVDENGNLADEDDRMLYTYNFKTGKTVLLTGEEGEYASSVIPVGGGLIYGKVTEDAKELIYTGTDKDGVINLPENTSAIPEKYTPVKDKNGKVTAILYNANIIFKEKRTDPKDNEEKYDTFSGGELYGIFFDGEKWGEPVAVKTESIYARKNQYINSYSSVLTEDGLIVCVEYVDSEGKPVSRATDVYRLSSKCVLNSRDVSYVDHTLTVSVSNTGAIPTGIYAEINGERIILTDKILSGTSEKYSIELDNKKGSFTVTLFDSKTGEIIDAPFDISVESSDLVPTVKQLLLGADNKLLAAVRNNGNRAASGKLYASVYKDDENGSENGIDIASVKKSTAAADITDLLPGDVTYIVIPLSEDLSVDENNIAAIYVESTDGNEKGDALENNIVYMTVKAFSRDVSDNGGSYKPEISTYAVKFDRKNKKDVEIKYFCAGNDGVSEIIINNTKLNESADYGTENGVITVKSSCLENLAEGTHSMKIVFSSRQTETVELKVVRYFQVRWICENKTTVTEVPEGGIPYCESVLEKASTKQYDYVFNGWDSDGDGNPDAVAAATENKEYVYTALWYEKPRTYTVTWNFRSGDGTDAVAVNEEYKYGSAPEYKGSLFAPSGMIFDRWDGEVTPVAGDAEYTALYKKEFIEYTVKFVDFDGRIISEGLYRFGDIVTVPNAPDRPMDDMYSYRFSGWDKDIGEVTDNEIYTAVYEKEYIRYSVIFKNYDGTVLSGKTYHYGDSVTAPETPVKASDDKYFYVFTGWDSEVVNVTENAEYTATFEQRTHEWSTPEYEWSKDNTSVTAKRVSINDSLINQTETVNTDIAVKDADCVNSGKTTYTASFTNTAFTTQTREEIIPAAGHNMKFVEFVWHGSEARANYSCGKCGQTAYTDAIVSEKETPASCTENGTITYTAYISEENSADDVSHIEEKTVKGKEASGHSYGEPKWIWDNEQHTATAYFICAKGDDVKEIPAEITRTEQDGTVTYTANAVLDNKSYTYVKTEYTDCIVIFKDYDGTILSANIYKNGDTVKVPEAPERSADNTYTYSFNGWDKTVAAVNGDTVYTAEYTASYIDYTVRFVDYEDTVLSEKTYHYDDTVTAPANPTREKDNEYTYTFSGWDKDITLCRGDTTYKATYTPVYIEYTVIFKDYDETVISENTYHYGDNVTVPSDPVREADKTYTYAFKKWDKTVTSVDGNAAYKATYTETYIDYTVRFVDCDGTILNEKTYHYGDKVTVPNEPVRPEDDKYTYTFTGWDKEVTNVDNNAVYTAVYEKSEKASSFVRGDVNGDGSVDNKDVVVLFRYVSSASGSEYDPAFDFNGDSAVDNKDVVSLFRHVSAG